jgi:hypothetical protein
MEGRAMNEKTTYLALMYCSSEDLKPYGREVLSAIEGVAGREYKRGESAAQVTSIAFKSDQDEETIKRAFLPLWRPHQQTWVIALNRPLVIGEALMKWVQPKG